MATRKTSPKKTAPKKDPETTPENPPETPPDESGEAGITREGLEALGTYLDDFLMLNPSISGKVLNEDGTVAKESDDISALDDEELSKRVVAAAGLLEANDFYPPNAGDPKFADEHVEELRILGIQIPEDPNAKAKGKGKGKGGRKPKDPNAPPKAKKPAAELDQYGFRKGTKNSEAIAMLATGKYTMKQVKEKLGATFYNALNQLKITHSVEKGENGTFNISPLPEKK